MSGLFSKRSLSTFSITIYSDRLDVAQLTSFSITIELQKQYDATRMPQQRWTSSHNMAAARSVTTALCFIATSLITGFQNWHF